MSSSASNMPGPYRVLLTREDNQGLRNALEVEGIDVVEVPLVAFEATGTSQPKPEAEDWVLFTSVNGVRFGGNIARHGGPIGAVGPVTAAALQQMGLPVDVVPGRAHGEALAAALGARVAGRRVWLPRAEQVPPDLDDALQSLGAEPIGVAVYRTSCPAGSAAALVAAGRVDAVAFASGSAARHYAASGGTRSVPAVVAIGPSTAAACTALGLVVAAVAEPHTVAGLTATLLALSRRPRG